MGKIIRNGISYGGSSSSAGNISYDNTSSGLASMTVQNAITELKDIVDNTDLIYQSFNVATTAWVANTDSSTSSDYPYIATITTNSYGDNDFPVWQLTGVGDVPTTAERVEIAKVIEAVFTSAGITLYANALVTSALVLQVAGCGANADGLTRTLLYTTGNITQGAPYQTDVNLLDNLNNYDMIMVLYPADTSAGRECCDTRIYDVSELLTSGYHAYYAGYMGRWCMVHFTNTTFNQFDRGSTTEGDQFAPKIYKIYGSKFNTTTVQTPNAATEINYSTREQKTRKTWFDGKPIYQLSVWNQAGFHNNDVIFDMEALDIDTLIHSTCQGIDGNEIANKWILESVSGVNGCQIYWNASSNKLVYRTEGSELLLGATIQYTKKSDIRTYTVTKNSIGATVEIQTSNETSWEIRRSDQPSGVIIGTGSSTKLIACPVGTVITVTPTTVNAVIDTIFSPLLPLLLGMTVARNATLITFYITANVGEYWEIYIDDILYRFGYGTGSQTIINYSNPTEDEKCSIRGSRDMIVNIQETYA